jgi:phage gp36-like protein
MAFINDSDYEVQVRSEILTLLDCKEEDGMHALRFAEKMAMDQIRNYIGGRFDMNKVFAAEGDSRDMFIVMTTIDIALYHIWAKKAPRKIPEYRVVRYNDALDWLKEVANGSSCNLPQLSDDNYSGDFIIESKYRQNINKY